MFPLKLCFNPIHRPGKYSSGKPGGLEIEWYTSASGLC
jgi:hypothetical protein